MRILRSCCHISGVLILWYNHIKEKKILLSTNICHNIYISNSVTSEIHLAGGTERWNRTTDCTFLNAFASVGNLNFSKVITKQLSA